MLRTYFTLLGLFFILAKSRNPIPFYTANSNNMVNHEQTPGISKILYVTMLNSFSKQLAIVYAYKFDIIVLCYYDVQLFGRQAKIAGVQNMQKSPFITKLKKANPKLKILLRMYFLSSCKEVFDFFGTLTHNKVQPIAQLMLRYVRKFQLDGLYFDSQYNVPLIEFAQKDSYYNFACQMLINLASHLKKHMFPSQQLFFQIRSSTLSRIDLKGLQDIKATGLVVTALQTDDYISQIVAALQVIKKFRSVLPHMNYYILIPLFSRRNGIGFRSIEVKQFFQKQKPLQYSLDSAGMCQFRDKTRNTVFQVPCELYFDRIWTEARSNSIGVGAYEAGDALPGHFLLF